MFLCQSAGAASTIKSIRYKGNDVTQSSVMNREIFIKPGDVFDAVKVEQSGQAIMDLGLFKKVYYYIEENYKNGLSGTDESQIDIVFVVKEKYYFYVLPKLKVDDTDVYYGAQLTWDNAWGLNHSVRLRYEDRGSTEGIDESRQTFRYFYPNVNDSSYNLDFDFQLSNAVDEVEGIVDRQDEIYKVSVLRWLNRYGRSRGWFVGSGVSYQQRFNDVISGDSQSESVNATALGVVGGYRNLNEYEYNRGGKAFSYVLDWSNERLGSESEYVRYLFSYRSYYRLDDSPYKNLNVQTQFGHSSNKILGKYAFSLGSRTDLRGYENNRFNGNTMLLVNMEYMFPHVSRPQIRYVYFMDIGNTYVHSSDILHQPLNVGAGLGLRWKIRSLVKIDLRADVGYGFTDSDYKFSFGSRHAF
ncbi:hypothetical protein MNBD_GAMMA09-1619 [hydrothermal vent metagenome]|uniref:POTRA domain-containing protein n=1 Tax=hydrothermal vent metagenome TaxID=652676 RepID=A0A3B0XP83_9ZZZZ